MSSKKVHISPRNRSACRVLTRLLGGYLVTDRLKFDMIKDTLRGNGFLVYFEDRSTNPLISNMCAHCLLRDMCNNAVFDLSESADCPDFRFDSEVTLYD
jgi:hypothetical protein